ASGSGGRAVKRTPYYSRAGITLYCGDSLEVAPELDAESVSAVVTDPPAGLAFMGKEWDGSKGGRDNWVAWLSSVMSGCERAMKPGEHALVWALPRTNGWTHRAIEDAGLDVRDCVTHLYGSGVPKSHNLSGDWQGWGTALKPGAEFWYLARKPFNGTVAANVLAHGTGALNIDASRIGGNTWVDEDNLCSSCAEAAGKKPKPTTLATRVSTAPSSAAPTTSARGESSHVGTSKTDTGCSAGQFPAGRKTSRTGDSSLNTAASG